jgi:hypothetical protein
MVEIEGPVNVVKRANLLSVGVGNHGVKRVGNHGVKRVGKEAERKINFE